MTDDTSSPVPAFNPSDKQRFDAKVLKTPSCWLWTGSINRDGYGQFRFRRKSQKSHRMAWLFASGVMPNQYVCHHCDTPQCVNPDHLFLGSQSDNMIDMASKGRGGGGGTRGEDRWSAILTEKDVIEIRTLVANGVKQVELAKRFGVSDATVSAIVKRKRWKHV